MPTRERTTAPPHRRTSNGAQGRQPTAKAPAQNFTGDVYVNQVKTPDEPSRLIVGYVRFTPGARTNWHFHALGQTPALHDGIGLVVTPDGTVIQMRPGDTVWTPPGEEHWHGATAGNFFQDCRGPYGRRPIDADSDRPRPQGRPRRRGMLPFYSGLCSKFPRLPRMP
jgi:quercetin dioxygenase-like cupin family protein